MNPVQREIIVYECSKCHRQYPVKHLAEVCCKEYHCKTCGKVTPQFYYECEDCKEKRLFKESKKMSYDQYCKDYPGHMLYFNEDYFLDLESLFDYIALHNLPFPDYVYGTSKDLVQIDIESAIEEAEDSSGLEDFCFADYADMKSLREFIKNWNQKNAVDSYYYDPTISIVFTDKERSLYNENT